MPEQGPARPIEVEFQINRASLYSIHEKTVPAGVYLDAAHPAGDEAHDDLPIWYADE
jgi:hypothetical protein